MNKITSIINALTKKGITSFEIVTLTSNTVGIMVHHDYTGLYPSAEAMATCNTVEAIARRRNLAAEPRGHYTATLIYTGVTV